MRLIDADALRTDYIVSSTTTNTPVYQYVSKEQIAKAPTIPASPRWVRCEDELPKENGWYLTIDEFGDCNACEWDNTLKWSGITKYEATLLTHWMPIEPPREGE